MGSFTTLLKLLRHLEKGLYVGRTVHGGGYLILPAGTRYLRQERYLDEIRGHLGSDRIVIMTSDEGGDVKDLIEYSRSDYVIRDLGTFGLIIARKRPRQDERLRKAEEAIIAESKRVFLGPSPAKFTRLRSPTRVEKA